MLKVQGNPVLRTWQPLQAPGSGSLPLPSAAMWGSGTLPCSHQCQINKGVSCFLLSHQVPGFLGWGIIGDHAQLGNSNSRTSSERLTPFPSHKGHSSKQQSLLDRKHSLRLGVQPSWCIQETWVRSPAPLTKLKGSFERDILSIPPV